MAGGVVPTEARDLSTSTAVCQLASPPPIYDYVFTLDSSAPELGNKPVLRFPPRHKVYHSYWHAPEHRFHAPYSSQTNPPLDPAASAKIEPSMTTPSAEIFT